MKVAKKRVQGSTVSAVLGLGKLKYNTSTIVEGYLVGNGQDPLRRLWRGAWNFGGHGMNDLVPYAPFFSAGVWRKDSSWAGEGKESILGHARVFARTRQAVAFPCTLQCPQATVVYPIEPTSHRNNVLLTYSSYQITKEQPQTCTLSTTVEDED